MKNCSLSDPISGENVQCALLRTLGFHTCAVILGFREGEKNDERQSIPCDTSLLEIWTHQIFV